MSAIIVTGHAVEQYVSRHRPELTLPEARAELEQLVTTAQRTSRRAVGGGRLWIANDVAMVARPAREYLHERTWVIVTVLPLGCGEVEGASLPPDVEAVLSEEMDRREAFARASAQREADATEAKLLAQRRESARKLLIEAKAGRVRPSREALARARALVDSDTKEGEPSAPRRTA